MEAIYSAQRVEAARRVAAEARRGLPHLEGPQRTSRENENFVSDFLAASRLHYIGSWKERFEALLDTYPCPPPLPSPAPGHDRTIFHIDLDCFFASVATRGRPELEGFPVAVCWSDSSKGNGEIASANYLARKQGVRNGMWLSRARELCPQLISMPYEFDAYSSVAETMYKLVLSTTPHVMGVSIDECYADLTSLVHPHSDVLALARDMRAAIFNSTQCYASIGIGCSRLVARLATRRAKPDCGDGVYQLSRAEASSLLETEPVGKLPGVGPSLELKLKKLGVERCAELQRVDLASLSAVVGPKCAQTLRKLAAGFDAREWSVRAPRKSIGAQASWGVRFATVSEASEFACKLVAEVEKKLRSHRLRCRAVSLKVWRAVRGAPAGTSKGTMGHGICDHISRTISLAVGSDEHKVIGAEVVKMLLELQVPADEMRGMGVSVGRLESADRPGALGSGARLKARVARAPPRSDFTPAKIPRWWAVATGDESAGERETKAAEARTHSVDAVSDPRVAAAKTPREADELPPSHPSLPPSKSSLPPSHTSLPPSKSSLPPPHTALPPSQSSLPPSKPSPPPSKPPPPPSKPSLPPSKPSLPPSHTSLPPSHTSLPPSHSSYTLDEVLDFLNDNIRMLYMEKVLHDIGSINASECAAAQQANGSHTEAYLIEYLGKCVAVISRASRAHPHHTPASIHSKEAASVGSSLTSPDAEWCPAALYTQRAVSTLLQRARALALSTLSTVAVRPGLGADLALRAVSWLHACDEAANRSYGTDPTQQAMSKP